MKKEGKSTLMKETVEITEVSVTKKKKRYAYERAMYALERIEAYISSHTPSPSDPNYGSEEILEVCIMKDARNVILDTFPQKPLFKGYNDVEYYYGDRVRFYTDNSNNNFVEGTLSFDDSDEICIKLPNGKFMRYLVDKLINIDREAIYYADSVACYIGDTVILKNNHISIDGKPLKGIIDMNNDGKVFITCVLSKVAGEEVKYTLSKLDDDMIQKVIK